MTDSTTGWARPLAGLTPYSGMTHAHPADACACAWTWAYASTRQGWVVKRACGSVVIIPSCAPGETGQQQEQHAATLADQLNRIYGYQ